MSHSLLWLAASISAIASGSNTNTSNIITHRTALSRMFWSGLSPYIIAAIYLIGPTSASTLRNWLATGARSSFSLPIVAFASSISFCILARSLACWRLIWTLLSALFSVSPLFITLLTWLSICANASLDTFMLSLWVRIFSSMSDTLAATSPVGTPWSKWLLLRNPKIPMLVINARMTTDGTK